MKKPELNETKNTLWLLLAGLFAVAIFLRLYSLGKFSLWYDELITAQWGYADLSYYAEFVDCSKIKVMKSFLWADKQPPLHYLSIYFWTRFFGETAYSLRMFSVICNLLAGGIFFK
ncbi:MAG: hypothetical protein ABII75_09150, partial [Candidatus Omnitrophota bacterium]